MPKLNNCQNGTVYILFIEVCLIEKSKLVPEQFSLELIGKALDLGVPQLYPGQGLGLFDKLVKGYP